MWLLLLVQIFYETQEMQVSTPADSTTEILFSVLYCYKSLIFCDFNQ